MKATVYSNKLIIGEAYLQVGDETMGCIFGNFIPTDNYYNFVQEAVWHFWSTQKPDYQKWHALNIKVTLEDGHVLEPSGGYTINDLKELPNEPITIDIMGLPSDIILLFK